MTLAQPRLLWLLAVLPLVFLSLLWADNRRREALARLGDPKLLERLSGAVSWRNRRWRSRLWITGLTCLIVALARPQWGSQVEVVEQEGVQVMVALDVSKSMLAQDLKPDRLTRAKLEISDLMGKLNGDEIGLVLFSGASFIQFPLTSDYDTARSFLDHAGPDVISRPGTAIGDAIRTAVDGFDPQRNSQKIIVIMTDGEDHEANALAAAEQAAEDEAIIYTIGFGSAQGEPIPEFDAGGQLTGYKKDESGQIVLSRLDEITLQQIALTANGRYFRASADGSELDRLVEELDALVAEQFESRFEVRKIERFQWFLLAALLTLVVSEFLPDRKRQALMGGRPKLSLARLFSSSRVTLLAFVLLASFLTACSASAGKLLSQGNKAFSEGAYHEAILAYQSAQESAPQTAEPIYNIANTYYRLDAFPEAEQSMQQALPYTENELAQHAAYNLGNVEFRMDQWDAAVEAYKEALRQDPDDIDAKYNLELALKQMQEQKDEQENQAQEQQEQAQADEPPQDQDQENRDEPEQADQGRNEAEEAGDQADSSQPEQQNQPQQVEALTEEQARQLLEAIGESTETLQERLQQIYVAPGPPPAKDW